MIIIDFECLGAWKTPLGVVIKWDYTTDQDEHAKYYEGYIIVPVDTFHKDVLVRIEKQEMTEHDKWALARYIHNKIRCGGDSIWEYTFDVRNKRKEIEEIKNRFIEEKNNILTG